MRMATDSFLDAVSLALTANAARRCASALGALGSPTELTRDMVGKVLGASLCAADHVVATRVMSEMKLAAVDLNTAAGIERLGLDEAKRHHLVGQWVEPDFAGAAAFPVWAAFTGNDAGEDAPRTLGVGIVEPDDCPAIGQLALRFDRAEVTALLHYGGVLTNTRCRATREFDGGALGEVGAMARHQVPHLGHFFAPNAPAGPSPREVLH